MRKAFSGPLLVLTAVLLSSPFGRSDDSREGSFRFPTTTPIKYLVVIFDENISFDHYFATNPHAINPSGEPPFRGRRDTPAANGLTSTLPQHNPDPASAPFRLDRSAAVTCDNDNHYKD